jgi:hypothetical protein
MDELIEEMRAKGLISFRMVGKARAVFGMLDLLAATKPMETDPDWWALRTYSMGMSTDGQLPGELKYRSN